MPKKTFLRLVEDKNEQEVGGVFEPDDITHHDRRVRPHPVGPEELAGRDDLTTILRRTLTEWWSVTPIGCVSCARR
jgi:hypothetical protein